MMIRKKAGVWARTGSYAAFAAALSAGCVDATSVEEPTEEAVAEQSSAIQLGSNESGDDFAYSMAIGDFNGDTFPDLAVGAPGEKPGSSPSKTGVVYIYLGSASGGLSGFKVIRPLDFDPHAGDGDRFGAALAVADFNHDHKDDLIVGSPNASLGNSNQIAEAGAVFVFMGSTAGPGGDLAHWGQRITQLTDDTAVPDSGDHFGAALAVGNIGPGGQLGLAVGVPGEAPNGGTVRTGWVNTYVWHHNNGVLTAFSKGIGEPSTITKHEGDRFGFALAVDDFSDSNQQRLVVGAPAGAGTVGHVFVYEPTADGYALDTTLAGAAGERFGAALATGNFDRSTYLADNGTNHLRIQLAVGAPFAGQGESGRVVIYNPSLTSFGTELAGFDFLKTLRQTDLAGEMNEAGDHFGLVLEPIRSSSALAVGVFQEDVNASGLLDVGQVDVFSGADGGSWGLKKLTAIVPPFEVRADNDRFGFALAAGNLDKTGSEDLVVGMVGRNHSAGALDIFHSVLGSAWVEYRDQETP